MAASAMGLLGGVWGGASATAHKRPTDAAVIVFYVECCVSWEEMGLIEAAIQRFRPTAEVLVISPSVGSRSTHALDLLCPRQEMAALKLL